MADNIVVDDRGEGGNASGSGPERTGTRTTTPEIPGKLEYYQGKLREVVDAGRSGWWRFHRHYDRDGYCDNPARGY